ncbi:MAG: KGG domain-containing protein [Myxococcota bacterium]|nr:KGG domain-containing protein [Myxococcota bacterium]
MSAVTTGTHPLSISTNEKSPQAQGRDATAEVALQELTPDRPPQTPLSTEPAAEDKPRRPRGFAAMDRKLVSEIARKGGKAAHSAGTAHEFTSEEARVAGRKGGRATHAKRRRGSEEQHEKPQSDKPTQ